jgi:predicted ATPase/two-component SAPR family response regulator
MGFPVSNEKYYSSGGVHHRREEEPGSLVAFPAARSPAPPTGNLPLELSSFIGREREIGEVERLLFESRLLTLLGPGGCGKTRLALAVARDVVAEFEGGAWWVELAPISDPDLVPRAVAAILGAREAPNRPPMETLVEHLRSREMLLILDNCEHLVDASASLAHMLLRSCPNLRILATSRESLGIGGEIAWLVPSLQLPDPARSSPAGQLQRYEAVSLFVERAKAVASTFELTEQNASAVTEICRRLDGIPLAIELAAARARVLSAEQIQSRLEDSLGLLTGGRRTDVPRQRTLRAATDWSYELLSEEERVLLRRLSVFASGFSLEAAEDVCGGESIESWEVLDLLAALVDKSLVLVAEQDGEARRYGMLEPIRQFAREKLRESQDEPVVRRRHAEHFLALAERAEPELLGAHQGSWHRRLRTEFANLREAHAWSLEPGEEERARLRLRLAASLWRFWAAQRFEEGKTWLRVALERDTGKEPAVRAKALGALGFILLFQQDYERAIAVLEEAVALYEDLGDNSGTAFALGNLGWAVLHGDYRERVSYFVERAEALMAQSPDDHARAFLGIVLASAAIGEGDLDSAVPMLEENLALSRRLGDRRSASMSLFILGMTLLRRDNLERGTACLEEGTLITRELGDRLGAPYFAEGLAKSGAMRKRPERAVRLWGAADALREQMGVSLSRFDLANSDYEQDLAAVRSALDESTFEAAWAEGRAMSFEQTMEYALAMPHSRREEQHVKTVAPVPALRIFALGQAHVERGDQDLSLADWTYAKPKELLYYLLSHPEGRTKGQIGLALWPEASPAQLRSSLHDALYRLRGALGDKAWIVHRQGRYAFERSLEYFFDVEAFEKCVTEARSIRSESPGQAIRHLQEAADLYGGDYLEDMAVQGQWAVERQEELRRAYQEGLLLLGRLLGDQDRHAEAMDAYRAAIAQDRLLEEAHRGLMRSQEAMGERGLALRHYEGLVGLLEDELGSSPAPETSALYEELRRGGPERTIPNE